MTDQLQYVLSDVDMKHIAETIDTASSPVEAMVDTIVYVLDRGLRLRGSSWEAEEMVDPTEFAIPKTQWLQIGEWLVEKKEEGDIARVNVLLDWMNRGPSAYDG